MQSTSRRGSWLLSRCGFADFGRGCRQVLAACLPTSTDDEYAGKGDLPSQPIARSGMLGGRADDGRWQYSRLSSANDAPTPLKLSEVKQHGECRSRSASRGNNNPSTSKYLSNRSVTQLCEEGRLELAFRSLEHLLDRGSLVEVTTYDCLVQACTTKKALQLGQEVHALILRGGMESHLRLAASLVRMYASFGKMADAQYVFDNMEKHNTYSWTALIRGYVDGKQCTMALTLFEKMMNDMVMPSPHVFVFVLRACVILQDLERGKDIHALTRKHGLETDDFVGTAIVDMYAKLGSLQDAREVFLKMPKRCVVCWTAMIGGCTSGGVPGEALRLYKMMRQEGIKPDTLVFTSVVNACGSIPNLDEGRQVHVDIMNSGVKLDLILRTALVDMYAKCGDIQCAREFFDTLPSANVISWTTMIVGYMQAGRPDEAVKLYKRMQHAGVKPNTITFTSVLKACASLRALEEGRRVHTDVVSQGLESDITMCNSLIDMYTNCHSLADACQVFENMPSRNVVSWTSLLVGFTEAGLVKDAISFSERMWRLGMKLDAVAFSCILKACASVRAVEQGKRVHELIIENGLETNLVVGNAIVYMYAKCGHIEDALAACEKIPQRNAVSWYGVIAGCTRHGRADEAIKFYQLMLEQKVRPNSRVITRVLHACARIGALQVGRKVHSDVIENGLEWDVFMGSALVHMYVKCGSIVEARKAFEALPKKNVVLWTVIMEAYANNGLREEAANLFKRMQQERIKPDPAALEALS